MTDCAAGAADAAGTAVLQYDILAPEMEHHFGFAISVLHAYAHVFECQVVYHPRNKTGMGLTDGEGTERIWSRTTPLIPITRHVSVCSHTLCHVHSLIAYPAAPATRDARTPV